MRELVILYSHRDETFVQRVARDLQERVKDARVFYDQMKDDDASWTATLAVKLGRANIVLIVLSPDLMRSRYTQQEMAFVDSVPSRGRTRPLALVLEPCIHPSWLGHVDSIDFTTGYEAGLRRLVRVLTIRRKTFTRGLAAGLVLGAVAGWVWFQQLLPCSLAGALLGGAFLGSAGEALANGNQKDVTGGGVVLGTFFGIIVALLYRPWSRWSLLIPVTTVLATIVASWLGFQLGRVWSRLRSD